MVDVDLIQTNFSAGELSPRLKSRVDNVRFYNGFEKAENALVWPQGGLTRRPGTRFVNSIKDQTKKAWLIPFEFSVEQAYMLEFGHNYIRFYKDGGVILLSGSPYEIATPYTEAMLPDLYFCQSADILYIVHPTVRPKELIRSGHTSWSLNDYDFVDGPYIETNTDPNKTLQNGDVSLPTTLTANFNLFTANDVGRQVRLRHSGIWGWGVITSFTNATTVGFTPKRGFAGVTATTDWRLGAWSDALGWPEVCTFDESRLWFLGSKSRPQTAWSTMSGIFYNFDPTQGDGVISDENAITVSLNSDGVHKIVWATSNKGLKVGTVGGEFTIKQASENSPLSPTNVKTVHESHIGSAKVKPVTVNANTLFSQRSKTAVFEFGYDIQADSFQGLDLTLFAEHLLRGKVRQMALQKRPNNIIWFCLENGDLIGLTYIVDQKVFAFHKHTFGGTSTQVESVAVIPGFEGQFDDDLWVIVKRTINGSTKRYVERLLPEYFPVNENDKDNFVFMDSSLTYSGSATTSLSNLQHLANEEVVIFADGSVHPNGTVNGSGQLTLVRPASKVHVGLKQNFYLKTFPMSLAEQNTTQQANRKKVYKSFLRLYNTMGEVYVGYDENRLQVLSFRELGQPMDASPPLFNGLRDVTYPNGYVRDQHCIVKCESPSPISILSITSKLEM